MAYVETAILEFSCYLARTQNWLPGHWRLVRWLNEHQGLLQGLPARVRPLGHGTKLHIDPADYDGLRYLIHGITIGDPLTNILQRVLHPGDGFVDVGANVGLYSVVAALCVGPTGRVLALEASPATFERLQIIALHGFGNIEVKHCAAAAAPGDLEFFLGPADHSGVSSLRDLGAATTRRVVVPADTLDRLLSAWPRIRFIKIDVEGAELAVIRGALAMIERDRPFLAMELTPSFMAAFGHSTDELIATIASFGYICRRLKAPYQEYRGLVSEEFQCDVVFVPVTEDRTFLAKMNDDTPSGLGQ